MVLLSVFWSVAAQAQVSSFVVKRMAVSDTLVLDSLSIMKSTFEVYDSKGQPISNFRLDDKNALLFLSDSLKVDSIEVRYRHFPFRLPSTIAHKDTSLLLPEGGGRLTVYRPDDLSNFQNWDDNSIQKSGSISRGIAFGNTQNLSVNSSLNLQMSGRISDRFQLMASVSDDNIPIQPNGNTQQLQDFDQVFIQIFDEKTKIIAGDFILKRPEGYYMNYYKRTQGAYVNSEIEVEEKTLAIEASASVSKGRFARNVIQGVEGNQGPYRLTGADNELFIIVIAGTEAVYIDGRRLERGQDKDYTIDYNSAEVTFTPRQFITKDRRIVVEFQYSDRRFARPLLTSALTYGNEKSKSYFNFYSESDAKNQPLQQDLTAQQRQLLSLSGDNPLGAFTSGIDSVGFSSSLVMYQLIDSLGFDSVLVYSTDPELAVYQSQFSFVGSGNGDYVEDGFTASGRKFKWVAPVLIDGVLIRQGNYVPLTILSPPKKRQMLVLGHKKKWSEKNQFQIEGAASINDLNTFSSIDSKDDQGFALRTNWELHTRSSKNDSLKKATWFTTGQMEYNHRDFVGIERFREVEFERNWNILGIAPKGPFVLGGIDGGWEKKDLGKWWIGNEYLQIGEDISGNRVNAGTNLRADNWRVVTKGSWLNTEGLRNTNFLRHISDISYAYKKWRITFKDDHELNRYTSSPSSDSLIVGSYQFYDWQVAIGTADTLKKTISVYYRDRKDWRPRDGLLFGSARAEEYGAAWGFKGKRENRWTMKVSNRRLRVIDAELFTQAPENTLVGRTEYYYKSPSGWIQSSTYYELGSGLEQRREFIYLEVPAGQGTYVWIDYNGDGVRDLNEFEIAQFAYEANFIRSYVQSTDYVRTYTNQFSQSIQIQTGKNWKNANRWEKFVDKWSNQTSYRVERKTTKENEEARFNPFINNLADSVILSLGGSVRNTLFFNKANPKFSADYTFQNLQNKSLLSNGFESRDELFHQVAFRWSFIENFALTSEQRISTKEVLSDFLNGRNYILDITSVKPSVVWQPQSTSRFNLTGQWTEKRNTVGTENAEILSYGADVTLNSMEKGSLQAGMKFYNIRYNGASNTSLSFDMLEGLNPGFNATWNVIVQRTIAKNLQLSLTYDGRKPKDLPTIHAGGMQLRAFF